MSTTDVAAIVPAIREAAEIDAIWFLGTLSMIKASRESTDGHMAVVEMLAPGLRHAAARAPPRRRMVLRHRGCVDRVGRRRGVELPADPSHTGLVTFRTPSSSAPRPPLGSSSAPSRPASRSSSGARRARRSAHARTGERGTPPLLSAWRLWRRGTGWRSWARLAFLSDPRGGGRPGLDSWGVRALASPEPASSPVR